MNTNTDRILNLLVNISEHPDRTFLQNVKLCFKVLANKKSKSINIAKKYKRSLLGEIKYYPIKTIRWLDMLPRRIYWFFQRGFRGFGDNDTWDFDTYLATIISQGLRHFKKYYHGTEPTKKQIQKIIDGFEANLKIINHEYNPENEEDLILLQSKFHRGMYLLEKYFNHLWD